MAKAAVLDALDVQRVLSLVPQNGNLNVSDGISGSPSGKRTT